MRSDVHVALGANARAKAVQLCGITAFVLGVLLIALRYRVLGLGAVVLGALATVCGVVVFAPTGTSAPRDLRHAVLRFIVMALIVANLVAITSFVIMTLPDTDELRSR